MPSNRYLPILNDSIFENMSDDFIRYSVKWYRENGYGGFAVNGRSSKPLQDVREWLPGYLETVKKFCQYAKEYDLDMWIFDEWGFPSGCACGLVLTPENRPKKLQLTYNVILEPGDEIALPVPARFLSAGAMPVNRFAPYHACGKADVLEPQDGKIVYRATEKTRLCVVTWENLSFVTHVLKDYKEGDPTIGTVDILDADTVKKFLDNMHERYVPYIGDEFGKTVKGFFYDEPEICYDFPYTPTLDAWFKERHGYDLKTILPELLAYGNANSGETDSTSFDRIHYMLDDYNDAWTSLLAKNFYGQIEEWCHAHNLESVGHQDLDNRAELLCTVSGDFYRNSARNDRPGVDVIWHQIEPDTFADFPRFAASVARVNNKNGAMSETFAVMGDAIPPDVMRYDMEQQVMRGIDTFFLYTFHVPGNHSDPNIERFTKHLMERVGESAEYLHKSNAQIAVLVPIREIARERICTNPHSLNFLPAWERLDNIAQALCYEPLAYEYVYEENMTGLYDKGFRYLILCGNDIDLCKDAVRDFADRGGKVINVYRNSYFAGEYVWSPKEMLELLPHDFYLLAQNRISLRSCDTPDGPVYAFLNESNDYAQTDTVFPGAWSIKDDEGWRRTDVGTLSFAPRERKLLKPAAFGDLAPDNVIDTIEPDVWTFCPDGGEEQELYELCPWEEMPGMDDYTGWCTYTTTFDWPGGKARINLGDVGFSAVVTVGGKTVDLPFSPWVLHADLEAGEQTLTIRVLNSYANEHMKAKPEAAKYDRIYKRSGLLTQVQIDRIAK